MARALMPRRLHIGCFDAVHDGWVNTDVTPHLFIARVPKLADILRRLGRISDPAWRAHSSGDFRRVRYLDITRRFRWTDGTFEAVHASHVLEHLTPAEAESCVAEVQRVMAPGGVVRIAVPDLDHLIAAYDPADPDGFLDGLLQGRERSTSRHRHWWHYNDRSLRALLERNGFRDVERRSFRSGRCPDVELIDNRPESLFMEAFR